jgi:hypothetical protein
MELTVIFTIAIGLFTIPVWRPITSGLKLPTAYWVAVGALTFSSVLQIAFIYRVGTEHIPLTYSAKFVTVGAPCCVIAMLVAIIHLARANEFRLVIGCAILGLTMWFFFDTLH